MSENTNNPTVVDIPNDDEIIDAVVADETAADDKPAYKFPKKDDRETYVSTRTLQAFLDNEFKKFVEKIDADIAAGGDIPSPRFMANDLLFTLRQEVIRRNTSADKGDIWQVPNEGMLTQYVSQLMIKYENVIMYSVAVGDAAANLTEDEAAVLAIYNPDTGIYTRNLDYIGKRIKQYYRSYKSRHIEEVIADLKSFAPVRTRTTNKYYTPVNNGIFNWETKTLMPFSPEYVYMAKFLTDYNPNAQNVYITMPDGKVWDCDWQMREMAADDDGGAQLRYHWQMMGAAFRPFWPWHKAHILFSPTGNNGKGTISSTIENVIGPNAVINLDLDKMSKNNFALSAVRDGKMAIIGHENKNDNRAIDDVSDFKALITNDGFYADIKHSAGCIVHYYGICIQNLNGLPVVKDRSNSFLRRLIFDPFTKCFEGEERKYIKDEYLKRKDVLEYYLKTALELDFTDFDIPQACLDQLDAYREFNDPVTEFWGEFRDKFRWNVLPRDFLYGLFKNWFAENNPSGYAINRKTFWAQLVTIVTQERSNAKIQNKFVAKSNTKIAVAQPGENGNADGDMGAYEPLIIEYNVEKYMNPDYKGVDDEKRARVKIPKTVNYGLKRV